jgi:hypothetical protein
MPLSMEYFHIGKMVNNALDMQFKRLTEKTINDRKEILNKALQYSKRQRNCKAVKNEIYQRSIDIIATFYQEQWTLFEFATEYQKRYGDMPSFANISLALNALVRGGGLTVSVQKFQKQSQAVYSIANGRIHTQCVDVLTKKNVSFVAESVELDNFVKNMLKDYGFEMVTANLTIFVKK